MCDFEPGEVEQGCAEAFLFEHAHVHLHAAFEQHAHFVLAVGELFLDARIFQEIFGHGVDVALLVAPRLHGHQQVEVADGFASAAQRTRRGDRFHLLAALRDIGDATVGFGFRGVQLHAARGPLEEFGGLQNVFFALLAEARQVAQFSLARQLRHFLHRAGLEVAPQKRDFLRPERLKLQQVEQRGRIFFQQFLAEAVIAGL